MLVELRTKSQITLPREIVASLGLSEGDKLDIAEQDGVITLTPVMVCTRRTMDTLKDEIQRLKADLLAQRQPNFETLDALLKGLDRG